MEYFNEGSSAQEQNAAAQDVKDVSAETAEKKPRKKFFTAKSIAYFGILIALELVLLIWGSAIPVGAGGARLNFSLLPIVLGAILMGPVAGALLGLVSGIAVLIMVVAGLQGVFSVLFLEQPVIISLICLLKTTLAGLGSGLLYRVIEKKSKKVGVFVASMATPVINTGVFILGCLCMTGAIEGWWFGEVGTMTSAFHIIIFTFVGFNFLIEFAINLLLAPALYSVIRVAEKRFSVRKKKS